RGRTGHQVWSCGVAVTAQPRVAAEVRAHHGYCGGMASGSTTQKRGSTRSTGGSKNTGGARKSSQSRSGGSRSRSGGAQQRRKPQQDRVTSSSRRRQEGRGSDQRNRATLGSLLRGGWSLTARGVGSLARVVGGSRELEAEHRRDGAALALLA